MLRTGFGVACIALLGAMVGCTTDVEDPGFTATAGNSDGSSGNDETETTPGSTSSTDPSGTSVADDTTGKSDETGEPGTTGPAGSSTSGDPTTGDPGGCGDGVVSPGEQCDGADLQGLDCTSLGLGTGTLGCDPMMCTFDTSMCMSDSGGTSG